MKRLQLGEQLPLSTPYSLHAFVSYYCNFKCNYCLHSLSQEKLNTMGFKKQFMSFDIFKKAVDDMKRFPQKLKALIFAGHGEPLMNKDIVKMVDYAKQQNIAERIEIVTNGSLLTPKLSDELISAGLDRLRISLQGVTGKKYKEVTEKDIDFEKFVENIAYFYKSKTACEVSIKIIDIALENGTEKEKFYDIFSKISDTLNLEFVIPFVNEIDYSDFETDFSKCKMGNDGKSKICSMPFYMLALSPEGNLLPCCSTEVPIVLGNVVENSILDVWNSSIRNKFLRLQLDNLQKNEVCKNCSVPAFGLQEGDYLDEYVEDIKKIY